MNQLWILSLRFLTCSTTRSENETGDEARRARQALLARRIDRVDLPLVDLDRGAGERSHRIDDDHRAVLVRDLGEQLRVRGAAGRGLGLHEGDDLDALVFLQCVLDLLRIDRLAPAVLDDHGHAAHAHDVLEHAPAEHSVHADDHLVTGRDHVDEAELHADGTGAREREGERDSSSGRRSAAGSSVLPSSRRTPGRGSRSPAGSWW